MNERAQLLGGACAIESRAGAGTTARVEIPAE
jgi:signal transduction histidine kinase